MHRDPCILKAKLIDYPWGGFVFDDMLLNEKRDSCRSGLIILKKKQQKRKSAYLWVGESVQRVGVGCRGVIWSRAGRG